jgi:hypothetical protein
LAALRGVLPQHHVPHRLHGLDLLGQQRDQLRHERVEAFQFGHQLLDVVGHGVDAVKGVEDRSDGPAARYVVAVRLPGEIVAQRAEEVVEIGDVVPQFGHVDRHVLGLKDHLVGDVGHLRHQSRHALHGLDVGLHLVGLKQHVGVAVLGVLVVERLGGALHAEHERDRGVLDRLALRPCDRLHASDARGPEDRLGDLVDDQEVRGVAQILVALDHQQLRIHSGGVEMPVGDGVAEVGRHVSGHVHAVVVIGRVAGKGEQTHQCQRDRRDQNRARPSHDHRAHPAPPA